MQFDGFKISPCGNAVLTIDNNVLTISGITNSGLDGVLINTENVEIGEQITGVNLSSFEISSIQVV